MYIVSNTLLMICGASLVLGIIHFRFWLAERVRCDYLAFSIVCFSVAAFSGFEKSMMYAATPEEYNFFVRWSHIASAPAIIFAAWFAYINLGGRRWLFWLVCATRFLALILNFILTPNINFREITSIGHVNILGEMLSYPIGVPNPWMLVSQFSQLLLIIFCLDSSVLTWRRGDRRKAVVFGTGVVFFALTSLSFSIGVLWGLVPLPMLASISIFFIIAAMVDELGYRLQSSAMLSDRLIESETELKETLENLSLSARAANVGLWTRSLGDNKLWISEKMCELFGFPISKSVTREEFLQKVHPEDRQRVQAALRENEDIAGEFQIEYRVLPDNKQIRWIDSRGKVERNGGKSKVVRGATVDVTKRRTAEEAVHELSRKLINAQEKERARLARELHDDLSQSLALLSIQLGELRDKTGQPDFLENLVDQLVSEVERLATDVRRMSHELHPAKLNQLGLELALRGFCRELGAAHSLRIEFHAKNMPVSLPKDISLCLYRITQESLQNVVKHSGAGSASVNIELEDREIRLTISDNGRGFDPDSAKAKKSLGLISIDERGRGVNGIVKIESKIGGGTKIKAIVPLS